MIAQLVKHKMNNIIVDALNPANIINSIIGGIIVGLFVVVMTKPISLVFEKCERLMCCKDFFQENPFKSILSAAIFSQGELLVIKNIIDHDENALQTKDSQNNLNLLKAKGYVGEGINNKWCLSEKLKNLFKANFIETKLKNHYII